MDRDRDLFRDDLMDVIIEEAPRGDEDCVCGHVRDEHTDEATDCMICEECIQFEEA